MAGRVQEAQLMTGSCVCVCSCMELMPDRSAGLRSTLCKERTTLPQGATQAEGRYIGGQMSFPFFIPALLLA